METAYPKLLKEAAKGGDTTGKYGVQSQGPGRGSLMNMDPTTETDV